MARTRARRPARRRRRGASARARASASAAPGSRARCAAGSARSWTCGFRAAPALPPRSPSCWRARPTAPSAADMCRRSWRELARCPRRRRQRRRLPHHLDRAGRPAPADARGDSRRPPASPGGPRCCSSTPPRRATRLKANPWIADATVLKLYPGRLHIAVTERDAFALWQRDGKVEVIADDGTVVEPYVGQRFAKLPLVVGAGAETRAKEFLALLDKYPADPRAGPRRGAGRRAALEPHAQERHRRPAAGSRRRAGARHAGASSTATTRS